MADDDMVVSNKSDDVQDSGDSDKNKTDDAINEEDLLEVEREVSHNPNDNDLFIAEKEAVEDDEFDEPLAVKTDLGVTDEANLPAELWEAGTGADDIEDIGEQFQGMSIKEFATEGTEGDEDSLDDTKTDDQNDVTSK